MLITFKSEAAGDVLMYEVHAKPLLELLGKDLARGVITAEESADAIRQIEAEIARRKQIDAEREAARRAQAEAANAVGEADESNDDATHTEQVSFGTRAFPLLEMLRAAHRDGEFVMWGV